MTGLHEPYGLKGVVAHIVRLTFSPEVVGTMWSPLETQTDISRQFYL